MNGKAYPRYFFTQKSNDIRELFCKYLDILGVEYRPDGPRDISIARRASVARLDALGCSKICPYAPEARPRAA